MNLRDQELEDVLACVTRVLYAASRSPTDDLTEVRFRNRLHLLRPHIESAVRHEPEARRRAIQKRAARRLSTTGD